MIPSERSVDMESRRLGNSDLVITVIGCGSWAIGGPGWEYSWGSQNDEDSIDAIRKALELGVNWIDTAAAYGLGHSEKIVARTLAGWTGARPYVVWSGRITGRYAGRSKLHRFAGNAKTALDGSVLMLLIFIRSTGLRRAVGRSLKRDGLLSLRSRKKEKFAGSAFRTSVWNR
jgi:aryl-alcohol dehydrogenase-like predicted oxidoreductase